MGLWGDNDQDSDRYGRSFSIRAHPHLVRFNILQECAAHLGVNAQMNGPGRWPILSVTVARALIAWSLESKASFSAIGV